MTTVFLLHKLVYVVVGRSVNDAVVLVICVAFVSSNMRYQFKTAHLLVLCSLIRRFRRLCGFEYTCFIFPRILAFSLIVLMCIILHKSNALHLSVKLGLTCQ